ncbi:putative HTH-type transcriptional regulator YbbH [bacterium HR40]|nr:putative HTH-type transcriptional regulator YbbH [bacterium HR40]
MSRIVTSVPESLEDLARRLSAQQPKLSRKLRQIGDYVLRRPEQVALETISTGARSAGVAPSAVVRFAQAMGFAGFREMQRLFRERLVDRLPSSAEPTRDRADQARGSALAAFIAAASAGLARLAHTIGEADLERAVELLRAAEVLHLLGSRRSFPIAAYLAYGFAHLGLRTRLLDGAGGMLALQVTAMGSRDLLIATSFRPYAPETVDAAARAAALGVPILAITDVPSSPIAALATLALFVEEAEVRGVRGLAVAATLASALMLATERQLARANEPGVRNGCSAS